MISACMVTLDGIERYRKIACESVCKNTSLVSEVLIAKPDSPTSYIEEHEVNAIKFNKFGTFTGTRKQQGVEHGLGLHACIEKAKHPYLMFHDPDVFFYQPVDKIFMDLMEKYKLDIIGVSHCVSTKMSYTYFPYLSCCLLKKDKLPSQTWLENKIKDEANDLYPGKFLIRPALNTSIKELFPNPTGDFDTGSLLWLWAKEQNWRWLAIQTADVHTYSGAFNRGSVKITEKFNPKQPLLYHATSSTTGIEDNWNKFKLAWEKSNDRII